MRKLCRGQLCCLRSAAGVSINPTKQQNPADLGASAALSQRSQTKTLRLHFYNSWRLHALDVCPSIAHCFSFCSEKRRFIFSQLAFCCVISARRLLVFPKGREIFQGPFFPDQRQKAHSLPGFPRTFYSHFRPGNHSSVMDAPSNYYGE